MDGMKQEHNQKNISNVRREFSVFPFRWSGEQEIRISLTFKRNSARIFVLGMKFVSEYSLSRVIVKSLKMPVVMRGRRGEPFRALISTINTVQAYSEDAEVTI